MLFNACHEAVSFTLPELRGTAWTARIDTARDDGVPAQASWRVGDTFPLEGRSMAVFTQAPDAPAA
jgi:glycogen operon protein